MRTYRKLLIPALVVGASLLVPAATAEAKVFVNGDESQAHETLQEAIAAVGDAKVAKFTLDSETESGGAQIPVGVNYTINGDGSAVLKGGIKVLINAPSDETTVLTIDGVVMDGGGGGTAISSDTTKQKSGETPSKLDLTVKNSTIRNFGDQGSQKALYINNAQKALIDGVTFENNNSKDYAVDFNLIGVKDAEITVSNSTFTGTNAKTWLVKVAQRCGEGDDPSDITCNENTRATVKKLTVSNNTFDFDAPSYGGDVVLGATAARVSGWQFPAEVTAGSTDAQIGISNQVLIAKRLPVLEAGKSGVVVPDDIDKAVFSSDTAASTALAIGDTFTPDVYLQTSAGRVELADVLNPEAKSFKSSDDKVATVDENGVVTAVAEGKATITATYGDQTLEWTVTVKKSMDVTPPATDDTSDDTTSTTEPVDNVENPQTYDGSMMFVIAGIISALGLAGAGIGLGKESE